MVPVSSLPLEQRHRAIVPRYLTEVDHVWIDALIRECERYVGRRRIELEARLKEPLPVPAPEDKLRLAARVLSREYTDRTESPIPPIVIRRVLFGAGALTATRKDALSRASGQLGIATDLVEQHVFSDLPLERRVAPLKAPMSAAELALRTNHAIVVSLLKRATVVEISAEGDVRALVRAAKLRGLLCSAVPRDRGRSVLLNLSGPYALFRHTLVYGRALASLVPRAARCHRFELRATCVLRNEHDLVEFVVRSGDPVVPAAPSRTYDSKVEECFARDFSRIALDWDLIREPEAVPVAGAWIFPDFVLQHRRNVEQRYLLEIVGFWTPEYLESKLRSLRHANLDRFILCIDAARNCADADLPRHARIIRYKKRVNATDVLRILEGEECLHN